MTRPPMSITPHSELPWREEDGFLLDAAGDPIADLDYFHTPYDKHNIPLIVRSVNSMPELLKALEESAIAMEKITRWLDRLAASAENQAKDTRFQSLAEANAADAKNYRNTIKAITPALDAARRALAAAKGGEQP